MSTQSPPPLSLTEGRFARLEAIEWWDQARLQRAQVLVIGAGALGNEVLKNLALLGIGHVVVVDMDEVELSNLSRSILFREADQGRAKAVCAAEAMRALCPVTEATGIRGNVLADVGLGYFRRADIVVGALDNREARVFVNSACARVGRPWLDGGIDVLQGVVRGFAPPGTACYECTMGQVDWDLLNRRRSCSLLARRAAARGGTPTTPTTASIIGALQAQEVVKYLHGLPALFGRGVMFDGAGHSSYVINYQVSPDCPWHEAPPVVEPISEFSSVTPLSEVATAAERRLGGLDALDLSRELVRALVCPACGRREEVLRPAENVEESQALCQRCQAERVPEFFHSIPPGSDLMARTAAEIGLPKWDVIWARRGEETLGLELTGDAPVLPQQPGKEVTHNVLV